MRFFGAKCGEFYLYGALYVNTVAIPEWNALGLLPPMDAQSPVSPYRSPYGVSLLDVVMRFATTPERCKILKGFLDYRALLHRAGYEVGFQWLDGSFMEDVEALEKRSPQDIDVVTFLHKSNKPDDDVQTYMDELDQTDAKASFYVDAYIVGLDELTPSVLVAQTAYWYSMWSHRRNQAWKGFLQVDLAGSEDVKAKDYLAQYVSREV